jgi:hypothetical protein
LKFCGPGADILPPYNENGTDEKRQGRATPTILEKILSRTKRFDQFSETGDFYHTRRVRASRSLYFRHV